MSTWRVGGKVPLNVYEDNKPMFQCHTPEDAARIVRLLNGASELYRALEDLVQQVEKAEPGTFIIIGDALNALAKMHGGEAA